MPLDLLQVRKPISFEAVRSHGNCRVVIAWNWKEVEAQD